MFVRYVLEILGKLIEITTFAAQEIRGIWNNLFV